MNGKREQAIFKKPVAMSAAEGDTFDLVKSLSKNEVVLIRKRISFYGKPGDNTILLQLFDALYKMPVYEAFHLKKFKSLSKQKAILWERILLILQSSEEKEIELLINRKLDFIHLLINRNLKKQAYREIQKVKQLCRKYDLLHQEAIAHLYEASVTNYMNSLDFIAMVEKAIVESEKNQRDLGYLGDGRVYYLRLLLEERLQSVRNKKFPFNYFTDHPLYQSDISTLPFSAAMDIANTIGKVSYLQKDYESCYRIQSIIMRRMEGKPVQPQIRWNWLRNRIALHEEAEKPDRWKPELVEMEKLVKGTFKNDLLREAVVIDARLRYTFLLVATSIQNRQKKLAIQANEAALSKAKDFISSYPAPIYDTLVAFLFANILKIYFDRNDHVNFTNLHLMFDMKVPRKVVPDIHAVFRIFLPIIHFNNNKNGDVLRTATGLRSFAKNDKKNNHNLDHMLATLMLNLAEATDNVSLNKVEKVKEEIGLLKEFELKVKKLKGNEDPHTLSVCTMFDLEAWANKKVIELKSI